MGFRLAFLSALVSIICGVMIFFLFRYFAPRDSILPAEGYAVLAVYQSEDDRFIREILEFGGIYDVISESSQVVFIDDFNTLRAVQLDNFHNEIAYFDPRDTGYAAKLKNFFVLDGKRFFFIPLESVTGNRAVNLYNKLETLLYGIPFSLAHWRQEPPFFLYFALLVIGGAFTFFFSQSRRLFFYQLPVLLAIGWGGFSTAILATFLCGIWELLREPLRELSTSGRYERNALDYAGTGLTGLVERLRPFRVNIFLALFFLVFILFFFIISTFPLVPVIAACVIFFFLNFISFQIEKERLRKARHIPFTPVLLFPVRTRTFSFFPFLLPFAAVSLFAISLPRFFPEFSPQQEPSALVNPYYFVTADDHYRHIAFQRAFPYRSLNHPLTQGGGSPLYRDSFLLYYLGDDGLIAGSISPVRPFLEDPPFPLEKLMEFLINYDSLPAAQAVGNYMNIVEWISVLIIFTTFIMDMIRPRVLPKKKIPVLRDKRIAA